MTQKVEKKEEKNINKNRNEIKYNNKYKQRKKVKYSRKRSRAHTMSANTNAKQIWRLSICANRVQRVRERVLQEMVKECVKWVAELWGSVYRVYSRAVNLEPATDYKIAPITASDPSAGNEWDEEWKQQRAQTVNEKRERGAQKNN